MSVMYKTFDLFGNQQTHFVQKKREHKKSFLDYEGFVEKFEIKKTSDDCITPEPVYQIVLDYVKERYDLSGLTIVRPFFPGGDYEAIEYYSNSIVIDNPPFSIISRIAKFYIQRNIRFFLFAPHLTLFSSDLQCTYIVAGADIVYENKAAVKTSFLSNLFGNIKVMTAPDIYREIRTLNKSDNPLPKYTYPDHVLTVSAVQKIVEAGKYFELKTESCRHCRTLDSQKKHNKTVFGSGFLLSEKAAAEKAAAEKAAAEKAAAEKAAAEKAAAENRMVWELSEREKTIIRNLK